MPGKQSQAGKKLKKISFDFTKPETRYETIELEGFEPLKIEFRVPNGLSKLDTVASTSRLQAENKRDGLDEADGLGTLLLRYVCSHLIGWSLAPKPTHANLVALAVANDNVVLAIFNAINQSEHSTKN